MALHKEMHFKGAQLKQVFVGAQVKQVVTLLKQIAPLLTNNNVSYAHVQVPAPMYTATCLSGLWFGTLFIFHILGMSSSQLTKSYFSEG